ncbi:uncharacterized protein A1O5_02804 [Cladophialophora psammophila CBS 110553]|uniref:Clr5 domain-containing protein n=1 Tax=Cladophialophora psammophila CBS 110553 TaxID=1182543 RepID=W9X2U8_9EURO|nr:uncharacterized protein A1O5_02804 [Cladophialophora psammophila CBS 110553]EXJ74508.1 hypothetical protein A1O5_02804 [Cladophialophora psammophila CBS 110553]
MDTESCNKLFSEHKEEITLLYVIDDLKLSQVKGEMQGKYAFKATDKQLTSRLTKYGIFKNVQRNEAIRVLVELQRLQVLGGNHTLLVVANGVLLRISDTESYCKRTRVPIPDGSIEDHELPQPKPSDECCGLQVSTSTRISIKEIGHPIKKGLYNRSNADISDLTQLSLLHNKISHATKQFQEGKTTPGWAQTRQAFLLLDQIVKTKHHRQFSDILGIIRMLQKDGPKVLLQEVPTIQGQLCNQLHELAEEALESGDPRRGFFETLKELPEDGQGDPQGHMVLAFDAYCRDLWMARVQGDDIKAYYSYNQSSFPRADRGRFYEKFEGKHREEILVMLREVDNKLGRYSIPTFCLWHTALHYLSVERRFSDAETISSELLRRVAEVDEVSYSSGQLNFDVSRTYLFLGDAQQEQGKLWEALANLEVSLNLRCRPVPVGEWDPLLNAILEALISVGTALGEDDRVAVWEQHQDAISSSLEQVDKRDR